MADDQRRTYAVTELGPVRGGVQRNEPVTGLRDLETHHPKGNKDIGMQDGVIVGAENPARRSYAFIGGQFQEVEMRRTDEYRSLKSDQVLLIKDFMLEDRGSEQPRTVDVPSPVPGYVGRVDARNGVVEIHDREGGDVIARARHLAPIAVEEGDAIAYGQSLGTQSNAGLPRTAGKHVHLEIDTRYYRQFENYIADLVDGRLPVQAQYRENVQPQPVGDDGTFRLGQSDARIRDLQRVMAGEGYRSANGAPLDQDGVYRPGMQGALLDFQRAHGLPQTGDIDPATLAMAPPVPRREADRHDYTAPGQAPHAPAPEPRAPGHPDHTDHRQNLSDPLPPPVNQPAPGRRNAADRDHPDHALLEKLRDGVRGLDQQIGKGWDDVSERLAASALVMAKEKGFTAQDDLQLAFNKPNQKYAAGEILHLSRQGPNESPDPAANRAHMPTVEALSRPAEERYQQVEAIGIAQERTQALQLAQQQSIGPDDPTRGGPAMRM